MNSFVTLHLEHNYFTWTNDATPYYTTSSYNIFSQNNLLNSSSRITSQSRNDPSFNPTKFVNLTTNNYALQSTSHAINTGYTYTGSALKDFNNNSRDSKPDAGAYEYR